MGIQQLKTEEVENICKSNQVKSLFAFGSVLRSDFSEASDIDLVVDLIEERGIKNRFFRQELDETKIKIYEH